MPTRRRMLQAAGLAAAAPSFSIAQSQGSRKAWPIEEGPDTPKLCIGIGQDMDPLELKRVKQIGVNYVLSGGPKIPWTEEWLRERINRCKEAGITLYNLMIGGFTNTLYGRAGRDEEIEKVIQSVRAAGRAGLPVVEYNFYAHRAVEGYYGETGRGGSGLTAFDFEKMRSLPPLPEEGVNKLEPMWANIGYFLKAVAPAAKQAGVKLALHPNDPPSPLSRGSEQIMGTLEGWKRLANIVNDPVNGITYDCGVTRELGEDPVAVCRWFAQRKQINHAHFRNVQVRKPYENYVEVAPDEGQVNMFAVMRELVANKYTGVIYPEHPRALELDQYLPLPKPYYPGGGTWPGQIYNIGYARAMLQAALSA